MTLVENLNKILELIRNNQNVSLKLIDKDSFIKKGASKIIAEGLSIKPNPITDIQESNVVLRCEELNNMLIIIEQDKLDLFELFVGNTINEIIDKSVSVFKKSNKFESLIINRDSVELIYTDPNKGSVTFKECDYEDFIGFLDLTS